MLCEGLDSESLISTYHLSHIHNPQIYLVVFIFGLGCIWQCSGATPGFVPVGGAKGAVCSVGIEPQLATYKTSAILDYH